MIKAVFLDKDGTLVKNVPYNVTPELIELDEEAVDALRLLQQQNFLLVVVSNQAGIAKGYFDEKALQTANTHIASLLAAQGIQIDAFYYCPHHPDGIIVEYAVKCDCRKPAPGLLLQAAEKLEIDLAGSWMIGDILDDVDAGHRAGCRSILYDNGNETKWEKDNKYREPDYTVNSLYKAAQIICGASELKLESHEALAGEL
ncbi:D-glycero-alpha-D-manno-heptose-1,7-bisphosphate 7-phosphatase [Filimonas effusa]|uniref:D,D-heptose 1,7-bisphosphate phosphatase n=1 Tax=Filimonas effusa TaxID=2508721 RepID=A0A4Q1D737_9BACT|nr:HAD family hydrolase [Filimonas effusa]RXK83743.1 HAD family hydrolase [Filimonas effusa]